METEGIRAFCHTITQENEDGRDVYVRMRSGKGRSRSTTIASGIKATGESPISLAYDLERRYTQLGADTPVWLEAVLEGTSKVIDVLKLPACPEDLESANLAVIGKGESEVNIRLIDALVEMSGDANRRVSDSQHMWIESIRVQMQMYQELMKTKADLMIHETLDTQDNVSEALAVLAPLVPALAAKFGAPVPKETPPSEEDGVDVGQATDQMIAGLVHIAEHNPDVITPERIKRLAAVVK